MLREVRSFSKYRFKFTFFLPDCICIGFELGATINDKTSPVSEQNRYLRKKRNLVRSALDENCMTKTLH